LGYLREAETHRAAGAPGAGTGSQSGRASDQHRDEQAAGRGGRRDDPPPPRRMRRGRAQV